MSRIRDQVKEFMDIADDVGIFSDNESLEIWAASRARLKDLEPEGIKSIRRELELSQRAFSHAVNVSLSTVQKWETGAKSPCGAALKLLRIIKGMKLSAKEIHQEYRCDQVGAVTTVAPTLQINVFSTSPLSCTPRAAYPILRITPCASVQEVRR